MNEKEFFGLKTSTDSIEELYSEIKSWLEENSKSRIITFLNPHVYNLAQSNRVVKNINLKSDIVTIDGVGIKLFLMLRYLRWFQRTIMTHLFDRFVIGHDLSPYTAILIGTSTKTVERASHAINSGFQGIRIIKCLNGFERLEYYGEIVSSTENVDFVLIGMGSPRSEQLIQSLSQLKQNVILWHIGGGTIKCYANSKKRSPKWLSDMGFEWIHRMIFETHLITRYVFGIPLYLWNIVMFALSKPQK